jgi:hypothetical protein
VPPYDDVAPVLGPAVGGTFCWLLRRSPGRLVRHARGSSDLRSNSRGCNRKYNHSAGKVSYFTSFRSVDGT